MRLYTMGAYLAPRQVKSGEWVWVVTGFEGDAFDVEGELVNPAVSAGTEEELTKDRMSEKILEREG